MADGEGFEFGGGEAVLDGFAEGVVEDHDFVEGDAAFVAGVVAGRAAFAFAHDGGGDFVFGDLDFAQDFGGDFDVFAAVLADFAGEALGEDEVDGGGDHDGFDAHVEEAADGAWGGVGVEGG